MSRRYCFTINNYTPEEEKELLSWEPDERADVTYLLFGRETGEEGTPHLQGYVELRRRLRLAGVKALFTAFARSHLESAKGTPDQNYTYCTKGGDFHACGVISRGQGARGDLDAVVALARTGVSKRGLMDAADSRTIARYYRFFDSVRSLYPPQEARQPPEVEFVWGPPGCGKTRSVFDRWSCEDVWTYSGMGSLWFDGYDGHDVALFDDFYGEIPVSFMLRLLDRYHMQVPVKGGFVWWYPSRIVVTSNMDPLMWFTVSHAAFFRRCSRIIEFREGEVYEYVYNWKQL